MLRLLLIILLAGLVVGIAVGPMLYLVDAWVLVWLLVGLLAIGLIFYKRSIYVVLTALVVGSIIVGSFRFNFYNHRPLNDISAYTDEIISFSGTIIDDPQIDGNLIKFTVLAKSLNDSVNPIAGKILVKTRRYPAYQYGNVISVTGLVKQPYDSPDFKYSNYLSRFGVYSLMDYPEIVITKLFDANWFLSFLYNLKNSFVVIINKILPEPTASFLAGLLLGIRQNMPDELLESFRITGLTHIIALSGFNITIIAGALMSWFRFLPLRFRFVFIIMTIISFVLLTGASPSVTRAAIMGILILLSTLTGRLSDVTISLLLTAAIMIWHNPKILAYDIGFQLSFVSTIGIVYFHPLLVDLLPRWLNLIKGYLSPTLSALLFVMPIIVYNFSQISLIAPVANVLVLPLIPISMGLGFGAIVLGAVNLGLGSLAGLLAWVPLKMIIGVSQSLAQLPLASWPVSIDQFWWLIIYYLIIISLTIYLYVKKKPFLPLGSRSAVRG